MAENHDVDHVKVKVEELKESFDKYEIANEHYQGEITANEEELNESYLAFDDSIASYIAANKYIAQAGQLNPQQTTDDIGMIIHPSNSQFISDKARDKVPIRLDGITIKPTDTYIYLGMPVSNQPLAKQVDNHLRSKMCHILKFSSFLTKNSDAPYIVKRSVWTSALNASMLYSGKSIYELVETVASSETLNSKQHHPIGIGQA